MKITWQAYYYTFWQFSISMVALLITTVALLYLIVTAIVKVRNIPAAKYTELHQSAKIFTGLHLIFIWIYISLALVFRAYITMFEGEVWCWIPDCCFIVYILARIFLFLFFLSRYVLCLHIVPYHFFS